MLQHVLPALEDSMEARLALGRHQALDAELGLLTARYPHRERLWGQLMLARYRCGRRADALAAYRQVYELLDGELGIEPGPALRELHERILKDDTTLTGTLASARAEERVSGMSPAAPGSGSRWVA
ncbi:AfsR/SARP family transcriptional regulator [Streptomyces viridochromogenes]|uniref:AfsR/SARP family transcriptional regulator n=1 Tax=Streptomyces viridochromogenes TaxID=1938 RepID=UPI00069E4823|nr:AfsR/SARP family transcriptional regulator [Streptomyces viridochromogenes]